MGRQHRDDELGRGGIASADHPVHSSTNDMEWSVVNGPLRADRRRAEDAGTDRRELALTPAMATALAADA